MSLRHWLLVALDLLGAGNPRRRGFHQCGLVFLGRSFSPVWLAIVATAWMLPDGPGATATILASKLNGGRRLRRCLPAGSARQLGRAHSRRGCVCEYAVNFGGHDEIVLMKSLDLLGLQRDCGITPAEADVRMMAFSFREFTNFLNKGKRLPEIAKPEAPLDAMSVLL